MNIFTCDYSSEDYILARYYLESKTTLRDAAWELAIGQSIGNPNARSFYETEDLFKKHSCLVIGDEKLLTKTQSGIVQIAFPLENINLVEDGISQLFCQLMGGQMDIDNITKCHLKRISFPRKVERNIFKGPKYGITGIRSFTGVHNKPLLGGIIKPKVIDNISVLTRIVEEMIEGGIDFIKEDEIMSSPLCCPLSTRVKAISKIIDRTNVIYMHCINSDNIVEKARQVYEMGGRGVHINVWSGLGAYKIVRDLDYPLFIHFQKSGDRVFTNQDHAYHIDWKVICDLAGLIGVDFIHAGMWGGYSTSDETELVSIFNTLLSRDVLPTLSCGMHAGLVEKITDKFGIDYMANVGGAIHSHPEGVRAGVLNMRKAIDRIFI